MTVIELAFEKWFHEKFMRYPGKNEFYNALRAAFMAGCKFNEQAVDEVFKGI